MIVHKYYICYLLKLLLKNRTQKPSPCIFHFTAINHFKGSAFIEKFCIISFMVSKTPQYSCILELGYWNLRGRAQIARLLLEYLKIPYKNRLFSNTFEWQQYKSAYQNIFPLIDLPFLRDGNVVISEAVPICNYIIRKSKHKDLLGRNLKDYSIINMYTWSIDNLGLALVKLCWMPGRPEKIQEVKAKFWQLNIREQIQRLQNFVGNKTWILGYLTLFDFSMYELIHYITIIFPKQIRDYNKLLQIQRKIGSLPEIKFYECSQFSIREFLPIKTLREE